MTYLVKSCLRTLQGEGVRAGRVLVLCRFAGCNLWSGHEKDRATARCTFCDTDFVGTDGPNGGAFTSASALGRHIASIWADGIRDEAKRFVVFTGGEPLLQLDEPLVQSCHAEGFEVGVETNGTLPCPSGVDWICVSPKAGAPLVQRRGDELKVVYPQTGLDLDELAELDFPVLSLQPRDGPGADEHTRSCVHYCLANPRWRLSLQLHKLLNIP